MSTSRQDVWAPCITTPASCSRTLLEGAIVSKISGQGEEKTYTVEQVFYEPPGATHQVSKNASQTETAKLLAMIFAKKGETLTRPGPARGGGA